jgi:hypothetical protein
MKEKSKQQNSKFSSAAVSISLLIVFLLVISLIGTRMGYGSQKATSCVAMGGVCQMEGNSPDTCNADTGDSVLTPDPAFAAKLGCNQALQEICCSKGSP